MCRYSCGMEWKQNTRSEIYNTLEIEKVVFTSNYRQSCSTLGRASNARVDDLNSRIIIIMFTYTNYNIIKLNKKDNKQRINSINIINKII